MFDFPILKRKDNWRGYIYQPSLKDATNSAFRDWKYDLDIFGKDMALTINH